MINSRAMRCRLWQDEPGGGGARGEGGSRAGRGRVEAKTMKRRYLNEARTTNFSVHGLAAMGHLAALRALGKPAEAEPGGDSAGARRTPDANEAE